jgi:RNA polymerase sigma factor (sigma-70 family)
MPGDSRTPFRARLMRVIRSVAAEQRCTDSTKGERHWVRRAAVLPGPERVSPSIENPEQTATNHEPAAALTHAIDALEPTQREVLLLRDVEGLSAPEVARILDNSVDAVKSRLHRARVAIRQELARILGRSAAPTAGAAIHAFLNPTLTSQSARAIAQG